MAKADIKRPYVCKKVKCQKMSYIFFLNVFWARPQCIKTQSHRTQGALHPIPAENLRPGVGSSHSYHFTFLSYRLPQCKLEPPDEAKRMTSSNSHAPLNIMKRTKSWYRVLQPEQKPHCSSWILVHLMDRFSSPVSGSFPERVRSEIPLKLQHQPWPPCHIGKKHQPGQPHNIQSIKKKQDNCHTPQAPCHLEVV